MQSLTLLAPKHCGRRTHTPPSQTSFWFWPAAAAVGGGCVAGDDALAAHPVQSVSRSVPLLFLM